MSQDHMPLKDRPSGTKTVLEVYRTVLGQAQSWREAEKDEQRDRANRDVCKALATELFTVAAHLECTDEVNPQSKSTHIVIRDVVGPVPYWAADETLPEARARFKRLTGRYPSAKATITAFTGRGEDIDKIAVDDLGGISYPKTVAKFDLQ